MKRRSQGKRVRMPPEPIKRYTHGQFVVVVRSPYPMPSPGFMGKVHKQHLDGYSVEFLLQWPPIISQMKPPTESRLMYFEHNEIREATVAEIEEDSKRVATLQLAYRP